MSADTTPRLTLDLHFDNKNRITWRKPLREKVPDADALRVVWNADAGRYEVYPIES